MKNRRMEVVNAHGCSVGSAAGHPYSRRLSLKRCTPELLPQTCLSASRAPLDRSAIRRSVCRKRDTIWYGCPQYPCGRPSRFRQLVPNTDVAASSIPYSFLVASDSLDRSTASEIDGLGCRRLHRVGQLVGANPGIQLGIVLLIPDGGFRSRIGVSPRRNCDPDRQRAEILQHREAAPGTPLLLRPFHRIYGPIRRQPVDPVSDAVSLAWLEGFRRQRLVLVDRQSIA